MENDFGLIRSFVKRFGRLSARQKRGLEAMSKWQFSGKDDDFLSISKPLVMEIGFGMGADFLKRVSQYPEINFIGIEVYPPCVGSALSELEENPLMNCKIIQEDANLVMQDLPDQVLDALLLYFPDPWPKKKHHKRRLACQDTFINQLKRILKKDGFFHYRTDWVPYHEDIMLKMSEHQGIAGEQFLLPGREMTKYQQRGERLDHEMNEGVFRFHPSNEQGDPSE